MVRRHMTPALLVALIALFVALGATGYAITKLPAGSVGAKQLKKNAVSSGKVKDKSLKAKDFKPGQLPAGPQGEQGEQGETGAKGDTGDTGPAGSALAYGYIEDLGLNVNVVPEKSSGLDSSMVSSPETGVYCFELESLWPVHTVAATAESNFGNLAESDKYASAQVLHNSDFGLGCPDGSDMVVVIQDGSDDAPTDWFFYVTLN